MPWGERQLLWDCVTLLDDATAAEVERRGGLAAIAISHPHYYSAMVEWGRRFGCPVYLHAADAEWIMRPDPVVELWEGERKELGDGLTLIRCGGHFEGGTVLHWAGGAGGRGALLSGDIVQVIPDRRHVGFMYSYPNLIPLPAAEVEAIRAALDPFAFETLYGAWWGTVIGGRQGRGRALGRALRARGQRGLIAGGLEDRREQAREARLEVLLAQRVHALGALLALLDDAGLAQHLEVMGAGRLRHRDVEAAAGAPLDVVGHPADHQQPDRIGERVEHGRELDLVAAGMGWRVGGEHDFSSGCTTIVVLLIRYDIHRTTRIQI